MPSNEIETDNPALVIRGTRLELRRGYRHSLPEDPFVIQIKSLELNSPTSDQILRMYAEHLGLKAEDFRPLLATDLRA